MPNTKANFKREAYQIIHGANAALDGFHFEVAPRGGVTVSLTCLLDISACLITIFIAITTNMDTAHIQYHIQSLI